ncbi:shikimate dehydrogenase [Streptomyces avermitilis]|uniref:Shikimate dehydrogenase (NADP(+)) n=2 Tax=Streptomyces avermitilis TaxID=33903 RepID=AROE_STRAW|nr:shikimate dehydrogenase [Streptomyces avermitilis]Q82M83.1 RecName: Full=Shikimate dehydrogenase (NADP(+)); Short=SDH [Streptomyces avermitilis MA-4680 = NBRC 14893]MYS97403.1 shikimate dehydrogenase [Streptomyces sp. SID5469]KUN55935.1 shikimate dehydrogenase [Streptomyces avermitilis]OOV25303.1 shikimate dehydrogenase (NADP+) [Streptomyces avermitilis]BAC69488.1 putative shikimate 5-dehydrogenase [Streptomyces avermitilis MA-4680 = NBRC 14893]BBJ49487.1 shikimate dehydrogenase (NADP(+)) 
MTQDSYLVGLIGSGIGPSLSPALHEREAGRQGLRYHYRLIDIDRLGVGPEAVGGLVRAARDLGFDGLNITHPCKQLVISHLDTLAPQAEALGAVNTVVFEDGRAVGHNTDVTGFAASFARGLPDARLERVVQLGAGGAGAAVAHALLTLGAGHVTVVDALPERAAALAVALNRHFGDGRAAAASPDTLPKLLTDADGIVHATPTGMAAHPGIPLPAELLHPGLWVAEVVYRPLETELLRTARALGCATLDGGGMAVFQAVDAFRLFTGREPDSMRMLADIAELAGTAAVRH